MGVWSAGSFGNDDALDYVDGLDRFEAVIETVTDTANHQDQLEVGDACQALAACDLLAAGLGRAPADLPELPDIKLQAVSDDVLDKAKALVERVRRQSELAQLWAEEDDAEWLAELDALIIRLTPALPYVPPAQPEVEEKPHDFIGHCYMCYGIVTTRNGLEFEHDGMSNFPHRACIEEKLPGDGPHWHPDGSPTGPTRRQLMLGLGYEECDLTEDGELRH